MSASCDFCRFGEVLFRNGEEYTYRINSYTEDEGKAKRSYTSVRCRRRPPVILSELGVCWPEITGDDWCGEFEATGQ